MSKEEFITERTRIISELLGNPGESGIYPTTQCFAALDDLFDRLTGCRELSWSQDFMRGEPKIEALSVEYL